jgi:hypothetical protein
MATSYANGGGTGNRLGGIEITLTGSFHLGAANTTNNKYEIIDGVNANQQFWFNGGSGYALTFDFGEARVIDEAKWYQSDATNHGNFKWQGSNDNSSYTDIGVAFALGGAATQTHTQLNGNTTAYRYYRLLQTGTTASSSPFIREIEFKIDTPPTLSFFNTGGCADRTAGIPTITTDATLGTGTINNLIDGGMLEAAADSISFGAGQSGKSIKLDFGVSAVKQITAIRAFWALAGTTAQGGTWKVSGSDDDVTYVDIVTGLTLGGVAYTLYDLSTNAYGYRYYKILNTSGTTSSTDFFKELAFQIGDGVQNPARWHWTTPYVGYDVTKRPRA